MYVALLNQAAFCWSLNPHDQVKPFYRCPLSHLDLCSGAKFWRNFAGKKGPLSIAHTEVIPCDQLEPIVKTAWGNL